MVKYAEKEALQLERIIMQEGLKRSKAEDWARDEIIRLSRENARLRGALSVATKVRPPLDDDLTGEPDTTKNRQP